MPDKIVEGRRVPWYQNFKGFHIILISFGCLILFFLTQWSVFDFAFVIGLIIGIIQLVKERKARKQGKNV